MDEQTTDRAVLISTARYFHLRPGDDLCPDVERIAATDQPLEAKLEQFRDELQANFRRRVEGGENVGR